MCLEKDEKGRGQVMREVDLWRDRQGIVKMKKLEGQYLMARKIWKDGQETHAVKLFLSKAPQLLID